MKKSFMKTIYLALFAAIFLTVASSCKKGSGDKGNIDEQKTLKIGALREDDSSDEASAWEKYLKTVGKDLNMTVDFTTTNSSSSEVSAINTYASKGYDAILLFSDDDFVASVSAAANKKMYVVSPTGHPTEEQYEQIKDNEFYLGSVAPLDDTEYKAGYDMAKYFAEEKQQTNFTIFGGATLYGSTMHINRLTGILTYLCEDPSTSYDGAKKRDELYGKVSGQSLDPAKFKSDKYKISGYMDGFAFDDAFSTKLTNSMISGGTCILTVGAGGVVTKTAYGITSANSSVGKILVGGVDAITSEYASDFELGYAYDCGKYASAMAPALILITNAGNGSRLTAADGNAPRTGSSYWIAKSREELENMLKSDNETDGYCFDAKVIERYKGCSFADFEKLCMADYETAKMIKAE